MSLEKLSQKSEKKISEKLCFFVCFFYLFRCFDSPSLIYFALFFRDRVQAHPAEKVLATKPESVNQDFGQPNRGFGPQL